MDRRKKAVGKVGKHHLITKTEIGNNLKYKLMKALFKMSNEISNL